MEATVGRNVLDTIGKPGIDSKIVSIVKRKVSLFLVSVCLFVSMCVCVCVSSSGLVLKLTR